MITRRLRITGILSLASVFALLVALLRFSESRVRYAITDLGVLPGGSYSEGVDLNDRGEVVAVDRSRRVFVWSPRVGSIDLHAKGSRCRINDAGQVVGIREVDSATTSAGHAYVWSAQSGMVDLGTPDGSVLSLDAINDRGDVLLRGKVQGEIRTLVWDVSEGAKVLEPPSGFRTKASDLNDSGTVIGKLFSDPTNQPAGSNEKDAFIWSASRGYRIAYPLENGARYRFYRINNHDQIVGAKHLGNAVYEAILWQDGIETTLPGLGGTVCAAHDINDRGQVVGYSTTAMAEKALAFSQWLTSGRSKIVTRLRPIGHRIQRSKMVWTQPLLWEQGKPIALNECIAKDSDWRLWGASAINNRGQIAGTGSFNGEMHAFLLTPISEPPAREE